MYTMIKKKLELKYESFNDLLHVNMFACSLLNIETNTREKQICVVSVRLEMFHVFLF